MEIEFLFEDFLDDFQDISDPLQCFIDYMRYEQTGQIEEGIVDNKKKKFEYFENKIIPADEAKKAYTVVAGRYFDFEPKIFN